MPATTFSTLDVAPSRQLDAWRGWYDSLYEVEVPGGGAEGFAASSTQWVLAGSGLGRVAAPALRADRTRRLLHRNPVDHWVIAVGTRVPTRVRWRDEMRLIPAGTPFVASLAEPMVSERDADDRLHLYLSRDRFGGLAPALDAARGAMIEGSLGALLRDYLTMLERRLPELTDEDLLRLPEAIGAMVAACVAPAAEQARRATDQIQLVRLERVRQAIRRHLRSARLGPEMLCRELGMSRSQIYRMFEGEGGVARYIQRCRLMAVQAALTDPACDRPIGAIAEDYGFYDPSAFSRSFRREFGMSPSEARASGTPAARIRNGGDMPGRTLRDCLRAF